MLRDVDPIYQEDVQRALNLLCCAKRPLLVEELMLAIAVELGDSPKYNSERQLKSSDDLQQICAGFIDIDIRSADEYNPSIEEVDIFSISGTYYEIVRIAHFSVQEFLKSDRIKSRDFQDLVSFHVNMQDANDQMAGTCLTFLLEPSILEAQSSTSSPLAYKTLRFHAARYWFEYYDDCTSSSSTRAQASRLFCGTGGMFEKWIRSWNHGSDINPSPAPLYFASLLGIRSVVYKLIEDGRSKELDASSNAYGRVEPFFLDEVVDDHQTALQAASVRGHLAIVQRLIEGGANINQQSGDCGTALQAAAENGHLEIVQLLIAKGADVNQQAGNYGTALHAALLNCNREIVELLIRKGANIHREDDFWGTPLHAAALAHGPPDIVQLLINEGANINQQAGNCETALKVAAETGQLEVVQLLIAKGADVNQQAGNCGTALQAASALGHLEIVKLLIRNGANISQEKGYYGAALQAASVSGHIEIIKLLLKEGSNINQTSGPHGTALQAAPRSGRVEAVKLLTENGADASEEAVQLLIAEAARVNEKLQAAADMRLW